MCTKIKQTKIMFLSIILLMEKNLAKNVGDCLDFRRDPDSDPLFHQTDPKHFCLHLSVSLLQVSQWQKKSGFRWSVPKVLNEPYRGRQSPYNPIQLNNHIIGQRESVKKHIFLATCLQSSDSPPPHSKNRF